jgi:colanic acid biosynthesis glycosyl transferase WcaI
VIGGMSPIALLISLYFPPEIGGGSTGAWNRALLLSKIGFKVFVICGFPCYPSGKVIDKKYKHRIFARETLGDIGEIRIRLPTLSHEGYLKPFVIFASFLFLAILYFPRISRITHRPSVVYARSPVVFGSLVGAMYSFLMRTSYVYEVPDLWPEELLVVKNRMLPIIARLGRQAAKLSYHFPNLILTVSESAAEYIRDNYAPKSSVYGIPVGVEPLDFPRIPKKKAREDLIRKRIFSEHFMDKFIVLYSGKVSTAQSVETLCRLAEILDSDKEILILIVGGGNGVDTVKSMVSTLNLTNLLILPSQPRELMPLLISSSDICTVLLSPEPIFRVALPTKFYEYLACGKPVLGICEGELAKMIDGNEIGLSAPFHDVERIASIKRSFKADPTKLSKSEPASINLANSFSLDTLSGIVGRILDLELHGAGVTHKPFGLGDGNDKMEQ